MTNYLLFIGVTLWVILVLTILLINPRRAVLSRFRRNRNIADTTGTADEITVSQLIREMSDQLIESRTQRIRDKLPPIFEVDSLDIEISFVVTRSLNGSGGLDLKVLRGDIGKKYEDQNVQKMALHLKMTTLEQNEEEFADFDSTTPLRPRMDMSSPEKS